MLNFTKYKSIIVTVTCMLVTQFVPHLSLNAQNKVQKDFLEDCSTLAKRRQLQYIAALPREDSTVLEDKKYKIEKNSSWLDAVDLFASKWEVTCEISDGYLLVGPQYRTNAHGSFLTGAPPESAINFLSGLDEEQMKLMRQGENIQLTALTPLQRSLLAKALEIIPDFKHQDSVEKVQGIVRLRFAPTAFVYSNGRVIGAIVPQVSGVDYEDYESEEVEVVPTFSSSKVKVIAKDHIASLADFIFPVAQAMDSSKKIVYADGLEGSSLRIFSSSDNISSLAAWKFITKTMDLGMRDVGQIIYVTPLNTLPSKKAEQLNSATAQKWSPKLMDLISGIQFSDDNRARFWDATSFLYEDMQAKFRFNMSNLQWKNITALHPSLKNIEERYIKLAVGPIWTGNIICVVEVAGKKEPAILPIDLVSSRPLEGTQRVHSPNESSLQ